MTKLPQKKCAHVGRYKTAKSPFTVGLIGKIASGKSTVAELFSAKGIQVISADQNSKKLTLKGQPACAQIIEHFGKSVLLSSGELNRPYLRQVIWDDAQQRKWLEALLHPLIRERIAQAVLSCQSVYCLVEIPLLFNQAHYPYLKRLLLVVTQPELQLSRLMTRDNLTREQALAVLAVQPDSSILLDIADDIIFNENPPDNLIQQIDRLHQSYLRFATSSS